jgi:hypothetical protein
VNKTIKKKWLKALRSGKYQQGKNTLKWQSGNRDPEFCCLGVLCEIQGRKWRRLFAHSTHFKGGASVAVKEIREAGIHPEVAQSLAMLNDTGSSFAEIADYIEANL